MKTKISITENKELQRKQFKIPERLNIALQKYAEKIDATENSIINGLLEDFMREVDFGTLVYNTISCSSYLKEKFIMISPSEHIGFNSDGNSITLEKRLNIEPKTLDLKSAMEKYIYDPKPSALGSHHSLFRCSFKAEQHTRITEHDGDFNVIKTETTSLMGVFNSFEELLTYFKIDSSWKYQLGGVAKESEKEE
ncbi:MAG: hypothetical protein ACRCZ9_02675 [Fusobacteriaceae bacterium]